MAAPAARLRHWPPPGSVTAEKAVGKTTDEFAHAAGSSPAIRFTHKLTCKATPLYVKTPIGYSEESADDEIADAKSM